MTLVKLFASSEKDMNEWFNAIVKVTHEIEAKRKEHSGTHLFTCKEINYLIYILLALVLDRAKKKAQEARAGLDERYRRNSADASPRSAKANTLTGGESLEELQAKAESSRVTPSRWESR